MAVPGNLNNNIANIQNTLNNVVKQLRRNGEGSVYLKSRGDFLFKEAAKEVLNGVNEIDRLVSLYEEKYKSSEFIRKMSASFKFNYIINYFSDLCSKLFAKNNSSLKRDKEELGNFVSLCRTYITVLLNATAKDDILANKFNERLNDFAGVDGNNIVRYLFGAIDNGSNDESDLVIAALNRIASIAFLNYFDESTAIKSGFMNPGYDTMPFDYYKFAKTNNMPQYVGANFLNSIQALYYTHCSKRPDLLQNDIVIFGGERDIEKNKYVTSPISYGVGSKFGDKLNLLYLILPMLTVYTDEDHSISDLAHLMFSVNDVQTFTLKNLDYEKTDSFFRDLLPFKNTHDSNNPNNLNPIKEDFKINIDANGNVVNQNNFIELHPEIVTSFSVIHMLPGYLNGNDSQYALVNTVMDDDVLNYYINTTDRDNPSVLFEIDNFLNNLEQKGSYKKLDKEQFNYIVKRLQEFFSIKKFCELLLGGKSEKKGSGNVRGNLSIFGSSFMVEIKNLYNICEKIIEQIKSKLRLKIDKDKYEEINQNFKLFDESKWDNKEDSYYLGEYSSVKELIEMLERKEYEHSKKNNDSYDSDYKNYKDYFYEERSNGFKKIFFKNEKNLNEFYGRTKKILKDNLEKFLDLENINDDIDKRREYIKALRNAKIQYGKVLCTFLKRLVLFKNNGEQELLVFLKNLNLDIDYNKLKESWESYISKYLYDEKATKLGDLSKIINAIGRDRYLLGNYDSYEFSKYNMYKKGLFELNKLIGACCKQLEEKHRSDLAAKLINMIKKQVLTDLIVARDLKDITPPILDIVNYDFLRDKSRKKRLFKYADFKLDKNKTLRENLINFIKEYLKIKMDRVTTKDNIFKLDGFYMDLYDEALKNTVRELETLVEKYSDLESARKDLVFENEERKKKEEIQEKEKEEKERKEEEDRRKKEEEEAEEEEAEKDEVSGENEVLKKLNSNGVVVPLMGNEKNSITSYKSEYQILNDGQSAKIKLQNCPEKPNCGIIAVVLVNGAENQRLRLTNGEASINSISVTNDVEVHFYYSVPQDAGTTPDPAGFIGSMRLQNTKERENGKILKVNYVKNSLDKDQDKTEIMDYGDLIAVKFPKSFATDNALFIFCNETVPPAESLKYSILKTKDGDSILLLDNSQKLALLGKKFGLHIYNGKLEAPNFVSEISINRDESAVESDSEGENQDELKQDSKNASLKNKRSGKKSKKKKGEEKMDDIEDEAPTEEEKIEETKPDEKEKEEKEEKSAFEKAMLGGGSFYDFGTSSNSLSIFDNDDLSDDDWSTSDDDWDTSDDDWD